MHRIKNHPVLRAEFAGKIIGQFFCRDDEGADGDDLSLQFPGDTAGVARRAHQDIFCFQSASIRPDEEPRPVSG